MTALLDLPDEVVATIYNMLPDAASKQALFSCCSALRGNASVLDQMALLTINSEQLHSGITLASLPRGVRLLSLMVEGSECRCMDDGLALLNLFRTRDDASRARVQAALPRLKVLQLKGCVLCASSPAAALGRVVGCLSPALELLMIKGRQMFAHVNASFFRGLSMVRPPGSFGCLAVERVSLGSAHIHAISQLSGLHTLLLRVSNRLQLAPLGSLRQLKILCLSPDLVDTTNNMEVSWLRELESLEVLQLDAMPPEVVLQVLPPSIKVIRIKETILSHPFLRFAQVAGSLPRLHSLHLTHLHVADDSVLVPIITMLMNACPQLRIETERVALACGLSRFLKAAQQVPAFSKGVKGLLMSGEDIDGTDDMCSRISATCGNVEELMLISFEPEHVAMLAGGLSSLTSLRSVKFVYCTETPPAGIGSVLIPLFMDTALSSSAPRLDFDMVIKMPEGDEEEEAARIDLELDAIRCGWQVAGTIFRRLGTRREVRFEATVL